MDRIMYIRDENRRPYGVLVLLENGNVGMSLCHPKDKWDKEFGKDLAFGRAFRKDEFKSRFEAVLCQKKQSQVLEATTLILLQDLKARRKTKCQVSHNCTPYYTGEMIKEKIATNSWT